MKERLPLMLGVPAATVTALAAPVMAALVIEEYAIQVEKADIEASAKK